MPKKMPDELRDELLPRVRAQDVAALQIRQQVSRGAPGGRRHAGGH